MLARTGYPNTHVEACRASVAEQVATYRAVTGAATSGGAADEVAAFEPVYFNALVLALDEWFLHRMRGQEGKDGNALNEVRLLCQSLTENDGVLLADKQIRLKPDTSVLGLAPGDRIAVTEAGFVALADAFLTEIQKRFPEA